MKKLIVLTLACVLACSFMIGAFASSSQAAPSVIKKSCHYNPKYPGVCDGNTCKLYYTYTFPWGNMLVWTGEYCCEP